MLDTLQRMEEMHHRMNEALSPVSLDIQDDSADHIGHGATGGHYTVRIEAAAFNGRSIVERHRMVYKALGELMDEEIHALSISARSPGE